MTGDNQQRHDGLLQPRKAPVQIKSKFLPSPDYGNAHFLDYGIVLFSMEQISARRDDNTLLGGIGALEKDNKTMPTGASIKNRGVGLVNMA